ncbi:hypothetical protein ACNPQK_05635 [Acinetobacter guillouiae]|uniref:hypothetical protein n=1 Tax=Acinetobacter guillouiae TaxID=106649 RepID=UPI003AF79CEE
MTTINNLTIEQMREIVEGAPEWAKYWITRKEYHMSIISFPNMTDQKSFLIDDLRTAISEHDEQIKCWSCDKYMTKSQHSANDGFCIHCSNEVDL